MLHPRMCYGLGLTASCLWTNPPSPVLLPRKSVPLPRTLVTDPDDAILWNFATMLRMI